MTQRRMPRCAFTAHSLALQHTHHMHARCRCRWLPAAAPPPPRLCSPLLPFSQAYITMHEARLKGFGIPHVNAKVGRERGGEGRGVHAAGSGGGV